MRSIASFLLPLACCSLLAVACGGATSSGGPGGAGTLSGSVNGQTFEPKSVVAAMIPVETSCSGTNDGGTSCTSSGEALMVALYSGARWTCDLFNGGEIFANQDAMALIVTNAAGPLQPGAYTVSTVSGSNPGLTQGAGAYFATDDSSCTTTFQAQSTSGTVTLSAVSSSHVAGTFDVTYGSSGRTTGSFDVDLCSGTVTFGSGDGGKPVCRQ